MRRVLLRAAGAAIGRPTQLPVPPERPRLLLVRPDHLGDLLMASPAVELLRTALPRAHLAMMVGPWSAEAARHDPLLDELLTCPFPGFTRQPKGSPLAPYSLLRRTAGELKRGRYDAALLLRFDHWWGAWMAALAGIPIRIGHSVPEGSPFLTHPVDPPGRGHWVERSLEVARRLLAIWALPAEIANPRPPLRFAPTEGEERSARELLAEVRPDDLRPLVALHPGAGSPSKLWPEDLWVRLGRTLAARGAKILVTGSAAEGRMAEGIAGGIPGGMSVAGMTGLGVLAALYRRCALVVGTDNGPMHLAVAMDVPTVQLFGPTDPAIFGPWGDPGRHRVVATECPCAPCGRLDLDIPEGSFTVCMEAIPLERVAAECTALLDRGPSTSGTGSG